MLGRRGLTDGILLAVAKIPRMLYDLGQCPKDAAGQNSCREECHWAGVGSRSRPGEEAATKQAAQFGVIALIRP